LAKLDDLIASYQAKANDLYGSQYDSTKSDYATQLANATAAFNNSLAQKKQALTAIPGQYQPIRNSAYLANQTANNALPAQMANAGYASNSGLAYDTQQGNNATWQKSVDTADTAQNTATQSANNDINNLQTTYTGNVGTLNAQEAKDLAAIDAAKQTWANNQAQTEYNNEQQAAATQAAAEAAANEKAYEASLNQSNSNAANVLKQYEIENPASLVTAKYEESLKEKQAAADAAAQKYNTVNNVANAYWHNTSATKTNSYASTISRIRNYLAQQYNYGTINDDQFKALSQKYHLV
jgi:hypothetical protein